MSTVVKMAGLKFVCDTQAELWRASTLETKEEGTLLWLNEHCSESAILLDIGANVGVYTLWAARLGARVYAVEPHIGTASSLVRNIFKNGLEGKVRVLTCALSDSQGVLDFNYNSMVSGSSGSQLGHTVAESGQPFTPVLVESKCVDLVDRLVEAKVLPAPTLVKLDVDGNELLILKGMAQVLAEGSITSMQVEVHPKDAEAIATYLGGFGYSQVGLHYTSNGKAKIAGGTDPTTITRNVIYGREG